MDLTLEQIQAEKARRKASKQQPQATPQATGQPDVSALLASLVGSKASSDITSPAMNYNKRLIGEKVEAPGGNDLTGDLLRTVLGEKIKHGFENDPNSLEYKKKEADLALTNEKTKLAKAGYTQDENGNIVKAGKPGLTPGQERQQDTLVEKIYATREMNQPKKRLLDNALQGADSIPEGFFGKMRVDAAKAFPFLRNVVKVDKNQIQEAQQMKMALTMGTLAETAHTKGAISDDEMALFKDASSNNDFNSPAVIPVLQKIRAYLDAEESGLYGAYQRNYGEDPRAWFEDGQRPIHIPGPQQSAAPAQLTPQQQAARERLRQKYGA